MLQGAAKKKAKKNLPLGKLCRLSRPTSKLGAKKNAKKK
jgi:hypothetical protein